MPIERKSAAAAIAGASATAAVVSIIAPRPTAAGQARPDRVRPAPRVSTIGSRMRSSVSRPAATIARSCASSASGRGEQQLEPALARAGEEGRRLVGAEVEHAHGGGAAGEAVEDRARARRGARASVGHVGGLEERELGAQQPDALGAGGEPGVDLGRAWRR